MKLSDTTIRNVKPGDTRKRLSEDGGLYLILQPDTGRHWWRYNYTFQGRRKTISLGIYPSTSLKLAREKRAEAASLVAAGIDPSAKRKEAKRTDAIQKEAAKRVILGLPPLGSFKAVALEWFAIRSPDWSESCAAKKMGRLERNVFPWIGSVPVTELTPPKMLEILRRIEARDALVTARRTKDDCSQVFRYAVAAGKAESDPCRDLKDALRKPHSKHMAAITNPVELADLVRSIEGYCGTPIVRTALRLLPMLLLRPGELRNAKWSEFDLGHSAWIIPAKRMKGTKERKEFGPPHFVPLPTQAVALLRELQPLTGKGEYVFRNQRHHELPMSNGTINAALRAMGYDTKKDITGHGFRATARTILDEHLHVNPEAIEEQLAHCKPGSLGSAYNRTQFLKERRLMVQRWADYLDDLRVNGYTEDASVNDEMAELPHAA